MKIEKAPTHLVEMKAGTLPKRFGQSVYMQSSSPSHNNAVVTFNMLAATNIGTHEFLWLPGHRAVRGRVGAHFHAFRGASGAKTQVNIK